jgi:hypothetical protein
MKVGYVNLIVAVFIGIIGLMQAQNGHPMLAGLDGSLAMLNVYVGLNNLK